MSANPLASIADYETFVYGLPEAFASIQMSTPVVVRTGPLTTVVRGEIHFGQGLVLRVLEVVNARQRQIERYPHHKHVPPDIKHQRVPAPGLSFDSPNLPLLIREIEQTCA